MSGTVGSQTFVGSRGSARVLGEPSRVIPGAIRWTVTFRGVVYPCSSPAEAVILARRLISLQDLRPSRASETFARRQ